MVRCGSQRALFCAGILVITSAENQLGKMLLDSSKFSFRPLTVFISALEDFGNVVYESFIKGT